MCGIFGFITRQGEGPEIARLRRLALITQTRGEHAFGLAWLNSDGAIETFKRPGPAQNYLDELERCRDAIIVIGHCRYATHGSPADNRNNHPHPVGAGQFVHNGVVHNHEDLVERYGLRPQTQCDSEVLGLLMVRCPGTSNQRAAWAANQALGDLAMLAVWRKPARLLVARRGRPLHFGQAAHGYYFASLPEGLPGRPGVVTDRTSRVLGYQDGELALVGQPIALGPGGTGVGGAQIDHPNTLEIQEL